MNRVEAALRRTASDLDKAGRRWALVGGFAVSARVEPRFTSDVDVAVLVEDDRSAEQLVHSFLADGYHLFSSIEHDSGRLATVRLKRAVDGIAVNIDLLFASSGIEPEVARAAEPLEIVPGLTLPVATLGHLIALKLLARDDQTRPQDLADLRGLIAAATNADLSLARQSTGLIEARGFNRGRDLGMALDELVASLRP
jgi:predicted nucleotidyltransferase